MASTRPKLRLTGLGAILLVVPAGLYVGTVLNSKNGNGMLQPIASSPAIATQTPRDDASQMAELAVFDTDTLRKRIKTLKTSKLSLERTIRDNEEKLQRIELRRARDTSSSAVPT